MRPILAALVMLLLAACSSAPPIPDPVLAGPELQNFITASELRDQRGRFREILCAVLENHGAALPDYRDCGEALTLVGAEGGASGEPVVLQPSENDFLVLMIPGLGWDCFAKWLDLDGSAPKHAASQGYEVRTVPVQGLSGTEINAGIINDYVTSLPPADQDRPIILIGYSKGTPDLLQALVDYPAVRERTVAAISLAGAVRGSPLADDATQAQANLLTLVPGSECEKQEGDQAAVASLRTDIRERWLAENPLPGGVRYYSVVTFPHPDRVSWGLENAYLLLGKEDLRNDTQVIVFDQVIEGSTLTAFVNADHWAIAVPVARHHPLIGNTVVNHNDYPREALLEALLRFVEEDLQR